MPLFGSKRNAQPVQQAPPPPQKTGLFHRSTPAATYAEPAPQQKTGLFHRNNAANNAAPVSPVSNHSHSPNRTGLFHRRNSPTNSVSSAGSLNNHNHGLGNGILSKHRHDDESIIGARERVVAAERAEADADRARQQAATAVHSARLEVKRLEKEAEVQARLAKHKAESSRAISQRAKPLGRHGP